MLIESQYLKTQECIGEGLSRKCIKHFDDNLPVWMYEEHWWCHWCKGIESSLLPPNDLTDHSNGMLSFDQQHSRQPRMDNVAAGSTDMK